MPFEPDISNAMPTLRAGSARVCKSVLSDSVTAGKSGKAQAEHIIATFGYEDAKRCLTAVLFDTTSSNTGHEHGLRAELEIAS
jgi:hypothetical protein